MLPGLVFLAAVGVAVVVFTGSDDPVLVDAGDAADAAAESPAPVSGDAAATPPADLPDDRPSSDRMAPLQLGQASGMTIGDTGAPMVMVAFESFGCLWCGHLHERTMPSVMADYVDQGLLRIEARMMPYEQAADPGARIGAAAGLQDRYWQLAEHLYPFIAGEDEPPTGRELNEQELGAYRQRQAEDALLAQVEVVADEIDLDWERFLADYGSERVTRIVERDTALARQLGFTGTPAMVVNGVPLGGYRSADALGEFLDAVLDASAGTG